MMMHLSNPEGMRDDVAMIRMMTIGFKLIEK